MWKQQVWNTSPGETRERSKHARKARLLIWNSFKGKCLGVTVINCKPQNLVSSWKYMTMQRIFLLWRVFLDLPTPHSITSLCAGWFGWELDVNTKKQGFHFDILGAEVPLCSKADTFKGVNVGRPSLKVFDKLGIMQADMCKATGQAQKLVDKAEKLKSEAPVSESFDQIYQQARAQLEQCLAVEACLMRHVTSKHRLS